MECPMCRNGWVQALLLLFLGLVFSPCAFAGECAGPGFSGYIEVLPLAGPVIFKAVVLTLILIPRGFRWVRMLFVQLVLTTFMWGGLMVLMMLVSVVLLHLLHLLGRQMLVVLVPIGLAGGAIGIVAEAAIMRGLSLSSLLRTELDLPFSTTSALGYSFTANVIALMAWIACSGLQHYLITQIYL